MLILSREQQDHIRSHLEATYPEEGCGLFLGRFEGDRAIVVDVVPTANAWNAEVADLVGAGTGKGDRYWIDPQELFQAMKLARSRQLEIIGIYHSHPDHPAIPSECDRRLAWPQYCYLIVSVQQDQAIEWKVWQLDDRQQFVEQALCIES